MTVRGEDVSITQELFAQLRQLWLFPLPKVSTPNARNTLVCS
jgi:hypothetical protein